MNSIDNIYKALSGPYFIKQELIRLLVDGLDRSLTHQEMDALNWIVDGDKENREIILKLFKELLEKHRISG